MKQLQMPKIMPRLRPLLLFLALGALLLAGTVPALAAEFKADYLYNLSDFNGTVPFNWVKLAVDPVRKETYVCNPSDATVHVYNGAGMELYGFGEDGAIGYIKDLAVDLDGDLLLLTGTGKGFAVVVTDFRGEKKGKISLTGIPAGYSSGFTPDTILFRDGMLYLLDKESMKLLVTDRQGEYQTDYDLGEILKLSEKKKRDSGIGGFTVDSDGDVIFTIPVFFSVYVVSPDRKLRSFGVAGSSPGKFNIIGGVAADSRGYLYVVDTLRCVISVFDKKEFRFQGDFGYRGLDRGNLIAPLEVAVMHDRIFVSQSMNRGVSVYKISAE